jgi:hypothetical protein
MLGSSLELKNIPVSFSILHELEYRNICKLIVLKQTGKRRRAFTDRRPEPAPKPILQQ